jgi:predicted nucleic acid-binding protein
LWFAGDRRVKDFSDALWERGTASLVAGANLSEFYYKTCQKLGKQTADGWYYRTLESGLTVRGGEELDRLAGLEKCRHSAALSLADCYALALAKAEAALLLTTDSGLAKAKDVRARLFTV